ncbi:MAG: LLM class flavin-dependent oxidoreductase, partial [Candidatus Thorarchaeota archaeon]
MEFGIQIEPQFGFTHEEVVAIAETCVKNGFSTVWFSDHFMLDGASTDRSLLDPWLLMTLLVSNNPNVRVGSLVFCNNYRHPPIHAKMAASLDVISGGRLEFGIGAGWKEMEYESYGIVFPDSLTRISQLSEAVQIIRGIWTNEKFSFSGKHYTVRDLISFPKPVQNPHPTIWIGTMYGRKRMVELAAKYGDGINVAWAFTANDCRRIFERLDSIAEKYKRTKPIKKSVGFWTHCFESKDEMEQAIADGAKRRN